MTIYRLSYSGRIFKAEHKQAGDKQICEVSICKKVPARGKEEERFDWIRVTIWGPPEWAIPKLAKGNYITGHGDLALRPYEKDGVKKYNMEVRTGSFDFEVEVLPERESATGTPTRAPAPQRPAVGGSLPVDDENAPPFAREDWIGA